ncbi:MAG: hypothetical protein II595_05510 [Desulfovibrio sp.]|nr:hypothetical protein [Desulfovibrio sp.]
MFKPVASALCLALALFLASAAHADVRRLGTPSCTFTADVPAFWTCALTRHGVRMTSPDGKSLIQIEAFLNAGRNAGDIFTDQLAALQAKGVPFALVKRGADACELSVADPEFGLCRRVLKVGVKAYSAVTCAGDRKACAKAMASIRLPE